MLRNFSAGGRLSVIIVMGELLLGLCPLPGNKTIAPSVSILSQHQSVAIAALANGYYQFCSQADPGNGRDGEGVCFLFEKAGPQVEGYYGYPHSDHFICLKGTTQDNVLQGEAFVISWEGVEWKEVPQTSFTWDVEGRLTLSRVMKPPSQAQAQAVTKILFRDARLDVHGFHQYKQPRMQHPSKLCSWSK